MSVTKAGVGPAEFAKDLVLGGSSGCLAKTICAPLERVKIVLQTAKSNDGMLRTAQSIVRDQGTRALWRGNLTNCARYFPTQAFNFAFKDTIKGMFPSYSPKDAFWPFFAVNMACALGAPV